MLFSSLEFLFLFLPIVLAGYFLPSQDITFRNSWLFAASLFFYTWGEPKFILIMIFSIISNYAFALMIDAQYDPAAKKRILTLDVAVNIGMMFIFKYLNFTTNVIRGAFPFLKNTVPQTSIVLPIGISFFTFQAMSYVIDVYRGLPAQRNMLKFGLYVSLFPQLVAGPIVRYTTVMNEISRRTTTRNNFCHGILRFMIGVNKKILLANTFSEIATESFGGKDISTGFAWIGALAYTFQIFFDFSGYSDMAIGLGEIFGFHFDENFDYPYISLTITEFWRRWHISLGTWFKDYVYFPLGGSRVKGTRKLIRNLMVVWCLTGIWHGANWTFIMWGLLYGVIIIIEKLLGIPKKIVKWPFIFQLLYRIFTLLCVIAGWVLFNSQDIGSALIHLQKMFMLNGTWVDPDVVRTVYEYRTFWIAALFMSVPILEWIGERLPKHIAEAKETLQNILLIPLFLASISCLVISSHNPFIYFNF